MVSNISARFGVSGRTILIFCSRKRAYLLLAIGCILFLLMNVGDIPEQMPTTYNTYKGYPLSIYDHPYKINTNLTCARTSKLNMIIVIHSKATNFKARAVIRKTWGNKNYLSYYGMALVFFLGMPVHEDLQVLIRQESLESQDIVQGTFRDSYTNITHKAVLWIRWVKEFCPNAPYILKLDDDVFVSLPMLYHNFIPKNVNESKKIWCHKMPSGTARIKRFTRRDSGGKHRVADYELKGHVYFPLDTCRGFFVILTQDDIVPLYKAAKNTLFFWIDDYYVFGDLAHKARIQHRSITNLLLTDRKAIECFQSTTRMCQLLGVRLGSSKTMEKIWEHFINHIGSVK